ncbi:MAG: ribosome-associated translation inhibitor RaiA [FCB group bacterium]|nr:ribosome-associated translation inhibitor RaiA [FCB group bacterium]
MQLTVSARHMELTDALKSHVETRLEKIRGHFDRVIDAEVVLGVEKHRHIAEVILHANNVRMHSKEESPDMYQSIDAAVDKLHKQIHKFKERGRYMPLKIVQAELLAQDTEAPEPVAAGANGTEQAEAKRVVTEKLVMKPMTVGEAILQLDLLHDPFLVFMNAESQQVNVVYSKEDGSYAVVEPQY